MDKLKTNQISIVYSQSVENQTHLPTHPMDTKLRWKLLLVGNTRSTQTEVHHMKLKNFTGINIRWNINTQYNTLMHVYKYQTDELTKESGWNKREWILTSWQRMETWLMRCKTEKFPTPARLIYIVVRVGVRVHHETTCSGSQWMC